MSGIEAQHIQVIGKLEASLPHRPICLIPQKVFPGRADYDGIGELEPCPTWYVDDTFKVGFSVYLFNKLKGQILEIMCDGAIVAYCGLLWPWKAEDIDRFWFECGKYS